MNLKNNLTSTEWVTFTYIIITTIMIFASWSGLNNPVGMLLLRGVVVGLILLCVVCRSLPLLKAFPLGRLEGLLIALVGLLLMIWWYPENYDFCSQHPYQDHLFAALDQRLFGTQPSLQFSQALPQQLWSELICMGYYSYYLVMAAVLLFCGLFRRDEFDETCFIFFSSFFLFYFIYQFLPVAGPCFYFQALIDQQLVTSDQLSTLTTFPAVGDYFRHHTDMMPLGMDGFFASLVQSAHDIGERPTAAFPSSHVRMGMISMMLAWKSRNKILFWSLMPFFILLCLGTVYIRAHYLIDSIVGFFTAILFYLLTKWGYKKFRG